MLFFKKVEPLELEDLPAPKYCYVPESTQLHNTVSGPI